MRIEVKVSKAIRALVADDVQFTLSTDPQGVWTVTWLDPRPQPTQQQILDQMTAMNLDQVEADNIARLAAFDADSNVTDLISRINTASVAQIDSWLTANVTTLAQARTVLATVIKMVVLIYSGSR